MKKIFITLISCLLLSACNSASVGMNGGADDGSIDKLNESYAIAGEDITLVELIGVTKNDAETVFLHYDRGIYEVDAKAFYKMAEKIVLTDIEDVPLVKEEGDEISLPKGMQIMVNGFDGYAYITDDCKVDKYGMHYSRLPIGAYTIKSSDFAKLRQFVTK